MFNSKEVSLYLNLCLKLAPKPAFVRRFPAKWVSQIHHWSVLVEKSSGSSTLALLFCAIFIPSWRERLWGFMVLLNNFQVVWCDHHGSTLRNDIISKTFIFVPRLWMGVLNDWMTRRNCVDTTFWGGVQWALCGRFEETDARWAPARGSCGAGCFKVHPSRASSRIRSCSWWVPLSSVRLRGCEFENILHTRVPCQPVTL